MIGEHRSGLQRTDTTCGYGWASEECGSHGGAPHRGSRPRPCPVVALLRFRQNKLLVKTLCGCACVSLLAKTVSNR
jgi:hypothetical protein